MHLTNFAGRSGIKTAAQKLRTARLVDAAIGAAISGLAALISSAIAQGHSWKDMVPLIFVVVLLVIAELFGARAGIISTVLAALIFASFLFAPNGSLNVASDSARANLGWMLLIGIAFSFLFAPPTSGLRRH
jgi:K+-sensing histidine kinase KdpD